MTVHELDRSGRRNIGGALLSSMAFVFLAHVLAAALPKAGPPSRTRTRTQGHSARSHSLDEGSDAPDGERAQQIAQKRASPAQQQRAREPGRGREADWPSAIPARGWKDVLWRVWQEIGDDRVVTVAAGVTYYVLLALFPAIGALVALYGLFADAATINDHMAGLTQMLPEGAVEVIGAQVKRVAAQGGGTLGATFLFGLAVALWSANAGIKAVFDALNIVYDEVEKRSFLVLNATSLAFTLGAIVFLLLAMGAVVVLPVLLDFLSLGGVAEWALTILRWPALLVVICLGIALVYRFGPSREMARWRWVTWGSALAAVLWVAASMGFSWYAANYGSYNETYGSLGAVIGFMVWIWISTIVILIGAEVNSEMEHQTARDTTTGRAKPLGSRGATMADTVGAAQT